MSDDLQGSLAKFMNLLVIAKPQNDLKLTIDGAADVSMVASTQANSARRMHYANYLLKWFGKMPCSRFVTTSYVQENSGSMR